MDLVWSYWLSHSLSSDWDSLTGFDEAALSFFFRYSFSSSARPRYSLHLTLMLCLPFSPHASSKGRIIHNNRIKDNNPWSQVISTFWYLHENSTRLQILTLYCMEEVLHWILIQSKGFFIVFGFVFVCCFGCKTYCFLQLHGDQR